MSLSWAFTSIFSSGSRVRLYHRPGSCMDPANGWSLETRFDLTMMTSIQQRLLETITDLQLGCSATDVTPRIDALFFVTNSLGKVRVPRISSQFNFICRFCPESNYYSDVRGLQNHFVEMLSLLRNRSSPGGLHSVCSLRTSKPFPEAGMVQPRISPGMWQHLYRKVARTRSFRRSGAG